LIDIKIRPLEFLPSDPEIWFSMLDKTLKENRIINDTEKSTYVLTAIVAKILQRDQRYDIKFT